jgi:hypothetical protein
MVEDELSKAWAARRAVTPIDAVMRFSDEGLVLGAGTVLTKSSDPGREFLDDPWELRLQALLAVAHLRRPTVESLAHLRGAVRRWSEGHHALASMHLSLSRVDRLMRPEADAHRLFLADGMLNAGFEANAIIDAIEAGIPDLIGFRKYDPDQPRVPAGSGRASGQWTSSSGDAAAGADTRSEADASLGIMNPPTTAGANAQPLVDPTQSEVNPNTITHVADPEYETMFASRIAHAKCVDAAVEASAHDAANDNFPRNLDLTNCRNAFAASVAMSVFMQVQPLPLGGGVRFPHGGVVKIDKGRIDRYVPPRYGYLSPLLRRHPEFERASSSLEAESMDGYSFPPWKPAPGEVVQSSPAGFGPGEQVVAAFCSRINGTLIEKTRSVSKQWGKIVRAKIALEHQESPTTALLTCWARTNSDVRFDLAFDCCGDCGKPE